MDNSVVFSDNLINVTWFDLDLPFDVIEELAMSLSDEELRRVNQFSAPLDRRRATVRIARRRHALATYLNTDTENVQIEFDTSGKPSATSSLGESLSFSSSTCGDLAVLAVTRDKQIGVDVEGAFELTDPERFASRVATAREAMEIAQLQKSLQPDAYLRLWTRKEAYLKATGEGIGAGFQHFEVPLDIDSWAQPFHPLVDGPVWLFFKLPCPRQEHDATLVSSWQAPNEEIPTVAVSSLSKYDAL